MSRFQTVEMRIEGQLVGPIWWPVGEECWKDLNYNLTNQECLWSEPGTLRDHLERVTMDGDFQHCKIWGELIIERRSGNMHHVRRFPLTMFPSVADMVLEDWTLPDLDSEV